MDVVMMDKRAQKIYAFACDVTYERTISIPKFKIQGYPLISDKIHMRQYSEFKLTLLLIFLFSITACSTRTNNRKKYLSKAAREIANYITATNYCTNFFAKVVTPLDNQLKIVTNTKLNYYFKNYAEIANLPRKELLDERKKFITLLSKNKKELPMLEYKWKEINQELDKFLNKKHPNKDFRQLAKDQIKLQNDLQYELIEGQLKTTKEDIHFITDHIDSINRAIDRIDYNQINPFRNKLPIEQNILINQKSKKEIAEEIQKIIYESDIDPENMILRYFRSSREDILRAYGSDKVGSTLNYKASDVWGLHKTLKERGLSPEDGFYALPFKDMIEPGGSFAMIHDLINGHKSLAIFDKTKFHPSDMDYVIFLEPHNKVNALIGIITASP